jgi:hypothetical protein
VKADILLSGLVSGITILLGVITADWLKRLRNRTEYTRRAAIDIWEGTAKCIDFLTVQPIESWGFSKVSIMSQNESDFLTLFAVLMKELRELSESPRWPQRNAKGIRKAAFALRVSFAANLNHCSSHKVLLHQENVEELIRLEVDLRLASLGSGDASTVTLLVSKKEEVLNHQMLSREAENLS